MGCFPDLSCMSKPGSLYIFLTGLALGSSMWRIQQPVLYVLVEFVAICWYAPFAWRD
jgi:hypothetical protein